MSAQGDIGHGYHDVRHQAEPVEQLVLLDVCAVAAALPDTTNMAGTMPMAKPPRTMLIRYSAPAILASWRGAVALMESIIDLPLPRTYDGVVVDVRPDL